MSDRKSPEETPDIVRRLDGFDIQETTPDDSGSSPVTPLGTPRQGGIAGERVPVEHDPPVPGPESALTDQILGKDPEPAADPAEQPTQTMDSLEVQVTKNLCQALAKSAKAAQLYPADNPMCAKFTQDLMVSIQEIFKIMDVIRLSVGKTKLFFSGETVLEQEGREESVPGRLFWAGVREISFHAGMTSQEVVEFLNTFRQASQSDEHDIVSLLWQAMFEHITYIAVDDILDLENETDVPAEFGQDFMNFVDFDMYDLEDGEEADQRANEMAKEIQAKINKDDASLFGITAEERSALLAEIEAEESPKILQDVLEIICETLYLETDEASFVDLVEVLSGALLALIGEGRLSEASDVVLMLRELKSGGDTFTPTMTSCVDRGLAAAYDVARRESLVRHLDNARRETMEALDRFVASLPDESIAPLCDVLGNLQPPAARKRLVEALGAKAEGNVEPFLGFLRDPRPDLVRAVAGILGQSHNDAALEPLRKLLRHPDFHVRREGLSALSKLGTGRALGVLADALLDVDPRIRMAAARSLGMAGRSSIPALLTSVEDPEFDERPLTEKRAFYEALGYAGGVDLLPVFKRALKRKRWFRKTEADEIRACACEALGWVGGEEARKLLTQELNDKSILVRTAAQSGLRRIMTGKNDDLMKEAA